MDDGEFADTEKPREERYPDPKVQRRKWTLGDKEAQVLLYAACSLGIIAILMCFVNGKGFIPLWVKLLLLVFLGPGLFLFAYCEMRSARARGEAFFRRGRYCRAIEQFSIGYDKIDPVAAMRLGDMHRDGLGTEADPARAMSAYLRSMMMAACAPLSEKDEKLWRAGMECSLTTMSEVGRDDAYVLLAALYDDDEKGRALEYARAAFRMSPTEDNEENLALRLIFRKNADRREADKGFAMLSRLAESGHGDSLLMLASIHIDGVPGLFDPNGAAARQNCAKAMSMAPSDPEAREEYGRCAERLMEKAAGKFGAGFLAEAGAAAVTDLCE